MALLCDQCAYSRGNYYCENATILQVDSILYIQRKCALVQMFTNHIHEGTIDNE